MPPKKRDKKIYIPEKNNLPEGITMPAVAATPTTPERLIKVSRQRTFDVNPEPNYVSPLKKLRKTMSVHPHQLFDTIDSLREFISKNDMTNPEIRSSARIRARLLWTTAETVRGLHFLRLYLGEAQALEPLKDQQKEYQEAQSQKWKEISKSIHV